MKERSHIPGNDSGFLTREGLWLTVERKGVRR